jgi:hypothetical protein
MATTIYRHCAPIDSIVSRHDDRTEALRDAAKAGAHVHEEDAETRPGWVYFVCVCDTSHADRVRRRRVRL